MKIKELKEKLGLKDHEIANLEIAPETAIVHSEFHKDYGRHFDPNAPRKEYREEVVDRLLKSEVSFQSESNIFGEVAKRVIALICPGCKKNIGGRNDGGAYCGPISGQTFKAKCESCNISVSLTMPSNGISITF